MTTTPTPRPSRKVLVSAAAVPVLVVGQFAMLAVVPVVLVLVGTLREARLRALRPWALALSAAYATALVMWAVGPDRAPSLSKDIHPAVAAVVCAAAVAVVVVHLLIRHRETLRRPASPGAGPADD